MLAFVTRILMAADIPPGPAIEAALFDMGDVIGYKIAAEACTLVDRTPQLAFLGIDRQAAASIANSIRKYAHSRSIRVEFQDVGAVLFSWCRVWIVDVRCRSDGDEHLRAVRRELHIARPVTSAVRQICNGLCRPAGL